jgi:hypothetical protein
MKLFRKKEEDLNVKRINASAINSMTIGADYISINNDYGHFEIGDNVGKTYNVKVDNKILVFKGGILVDIVERND